MSGLVDISTASRDGKLAVMKKLAVHNSRADSGLPDDERCAAVMQY